MAIDFALCAMCLCRVCQKSIDDVRNKCRHFIRLQTNSNSRHVVAPENDHQCHTVSAYCRLSKLRAIGNPNSEPKKKKKTSADSSFDVILKLNVNSTGDIDSIEIGRWKRTEKVNFTTSLHCRRNVMNFRKLNGMGYGPISCHQAPTSCRHGAVIFASSPPNTKNC